MRKSVLWALLLSGCGTASLSLEVTLVTDFQSLKDFNAIHVVVDGDETIHPVFLGQSFFPEEQRVAFFEGLGANEGRRVELFLSDGQGERVAGQTKVFSHVQNRRMRFVFQRLCRNKNCGDDSFCSDGECIPNQCAIDPLASGCPVRCSEQDLSLCQPENMCATAFCFEARCFSDSSQNLCASDELCDLDFGCLPIEQGCISDTECDEVGGECVVGSCVEQACAEPNCSEKTCVYNFSPDGVACSSGECVAGVCDLPSCDDGVRNQGELGVDCGEVCSRGCGIGTECSGAADCLEVCDLLDSGRCEARNTCGNSLVENDEVCDDGNTDDTDDCPDDCSRRRLGSLCGANEECLSGLCAGRCLNPSPTFLKAQVPDVGDSLGHSIDSDGDTIVVSSLFEAGCGSSVDANAMDNNCRSAGAVYVFRQSGGTWVQEAYVKPSNMDAMDAFGQTVAISGDTMVVGSSSESSCDENLPDDNSCPLAGAAYVFRRVGTTWSQEAYLKAANPDSRDAFGFSVDIDGDRIVVGAFLDASCAQGTGGNDSQNGCVGAGSAQVFQRSGSTWTRQAYLKSSFPDQSDAGFGSRVAISGDLVVASSVDASCATGVGGDITNTACPNSGAVFAFAAQGNIWSSDAYIKASNTEAVDRFGTKLVLEGQRLFVVSSGESSCATGIDGDESDNGCMRSGAVYLFERDSGAWSQKHYIKASNTQSEDSFGISLAAFGDRFIVGSQGEDSCSRSIDGDQGDNMCSSSGAAYVFSIAGNSVTQTSYLKAPSSEATDAWGFATTIFSVGLAMGARLDDSCATGIGGDASNNGCMASGGLFVWDEQP